MSTKKKLVVFGFVGVAVLAVIAAVILFTSNKTGQDSAKSTISTVDLREVQNLEKIINGKTPKDQMEAIAPDLREEIKNNPELKSEEVILAPGQTIHFRTETFHAEGDGAQIEATTSDGKTCTVYLVRVDGHWFIFQTTELK